MIDLQKLFVAALDRQVNLLVSGALGILFTALGVFWAEPGWGQMMMLWSGGVQCGYGIMWWIAPHVSERWRREMDAEIKLMVASTLQRATQDTLSAIWSPRTAPDHPPKERLQ